MSAIIYIANSETYDFEVETCKEICEENQLQIDKITCTSPEDLLDYLKTSMIKGQCIVMYSLYNISPTQLTFFNIYEFIKKKKGFILTRDNQIDTRKKDDLLGLYSWYYHQIRSYTRQEVLGMAKRAIGIDLSFIEHTL